MNCPHCGSNKVEFSHTREDYFDGDEDDIYRCLDCKRTIVVYVPR